MSTGQIEVDGALYRVVEADARYSIVREADGVVLGSFLLDQLGESLHADALSPGALEPELVLAIAQLLSGPRGLLPIQ